MAFWEDKTLDEMSHEEWEALCDGCGRCCLLKLEDEDTLELYASDVHCVLLDGHECRCTDYEHRHKRVKDCIKLTPENVLTIDWIPKSCAYRRLAEGRGLAWWHPLVSGDPQTVVDAGISVKDRTVNEQSVKPGEWESHIADWPNYEPAEKV
jgi:uncharacterized cysteine cluster protein YcgN (CxxCxxCC family)